MRAVWGRNRTVPLAGCEAGRIAQSRAFATEVHVLKICSAARARVLVAGAAHGRITRRPLDGQEVPLGDLLAGGGPPTVSRLPGSTG